MVGQCAEQGIPRYSQGVSRGLPRRCPTLPGQGETGRGPSQIFTRPWLKAALKHTLVPADDQVRRPAGEPRAQGIPRGAIAPTGSSVPLSRDLSNPADEVEEHGHVAGIQHTVRHAARAIHDRAGRDFGGLAAPLLIVKVLATVAVPVPSVTISNSSSGCWWILCGLLPGAIRQLPTRRFFSCSVWP